MKHNTAISIGIIAYNESANIKALINSILRQKMTGSTISEIILISDGSTDNTVEQAKKTNTTVLRIIEGSSRKGKIERLNQLSKLFKGDILIQLDADTILLEKESLAILVEPIRKNKSDLVSGKAMPLSSKSYIGKVLNFSVLFKIDLYEKILRKNNVYLCKGQIRAFSKNLISKIVWENTAGEDAFSYFYCLKHKFRFVYVPKAIVYYKSPTSLHDHLLQSTRFLHSQKAMTEIFSKTVVQSAYTIPKILVISLSVAYFFKNPVFFSSYILIFLFSKLRAHFKIEEGAIWKLALSSKSLI